MRQETFQPFLVQRQTVVANVEVIDALALVVDAFHEVSKLSTMDVDILKVQFSQIGQVINHTLKAIHEDNLIDDDVRYPQSSELAVVLVGEGLQE